MGRESLVGDKAVWDRFLPVPEAPGSHVVLLDGGTEFEKLEGCVTCLWVRLRG